MPFSTDTCSRSADLVGPNAEGMDSGNTPPTWFLSKHFLNWLMLGGTFRRWVRICAKVGKGDGEQLAVMRYHAPN